MVLDSLRRIVRSFRVSARSVEGRLGISAAQLFVLHQLVESDASSIDELAARTLTHQSSVSVVVARLAERGLVVRRTSRDDGRRTEIALSAAGRAMLRRAPESLQEHLLRALTRMPAAQLRTLGRQLAALVEALEVDTGAVPMFFEDEPPPRRSTTPRRRYGRHPR